MISLRPVRHRDVRPLGRLSVAPDQQDLVSPNLATLAEAPFVAGSHVWGLWSAGARVGLLAMVHDRAAAPAPDLDGNAAYLWRLMIDARRQGRGFGAAAVRSAMAIARGWGAAGLSAHVADAPHAALDFYRGLGFAPTGRAIGEGDAREIEIFARVPPPGA
ncbi:MAG: GNAT family N-acetyltransferase [Pseudomonadota bacterium]